MIDAAELRSRAEQLMWFHSIDLGQGVVTKGLSTGPYVSEDVLPDLHGRSVLDVGAWDGYYSFLAERLGASRVVALDHYVWGVDIAARQLYWDECRAKGVLPDHGKDTTDFWRPELPGRRGFDLAREALDSKVEPVLGDFMTVDLAALGTFDVVFYFGVLYHMKEPLTALERVRAVTTTAAVIETAGLHVPGLESASLLQFHAGDGLAADYGNWYVPNAAGLRHLCLAAGFSRVEICSLPPAAPTSPLDAATARRRARQALGALQGQQPAPQLSNYRIVARAYP